MKFIGPIPPTSWSPLVLSLLATSYDAAVFMVALAVWFPVTLMTSSGIQNVNNSYFEVAETLGVAKAKTIFKVAVPAAMPSIFFRDFLCYMQFICNIGNSRASRSKCRTWLVS